MNTYPQSSHIDEVERQKRLSAWNKNYANFALEGIFPSDDMKRIADLYINGEITFEQRSEMMKESIFSGR